MQAELGVKVELLVGRDQVEQQGLEAVGRPVLDDGVLFRRELGHGAVGPDLPELVVEGLVGHHQLQQLLAERIVDFLEEGGEGAHGQAFGQADAVIDIGFGAPGIDRGIFRRIDQIERREAGGDGPERILPAEVDLQSEGARAEEIGGVGPGRVFQ